MEAPRMQCFPLKASMSLSLVNCILFFVFCFFLFPAFVRSEERSVQQGPRAPESMVRILANGEIVQDDDPRVRTATPPHSSTPRQVGTQPPWKASPPMEGG